MRSANGVHHGPDLVRVDFEACCESIGMTCQGVRRRLVAETDQPDRDAVAVHGRQGDRNRVLPADQLVRDILEHVLGRELHVLAGRILRKVRRDSLPPRVAAREPDHQVDDSDVGRHHGRAIRSAALETLHPVTVRPGERTAGRWYPPSTTAPHSGQSNPAQQAGSPSGTGSSTSAASAPAPPVRSTA